MAQPGLQAGSIVPQTVFNYCLLPPLKVEQVFALKGLFGESDKKINNCKMTKIAVADMD